uniref:Uncharacterized protein n=1 Tax=Populus trichocarpa TaxID=3694 RepID=A0A3N7FUE6_POPTR
MTYITRPKEKRENLKRKVNLFIDPKSCHSPKLSFHLCLLSFYHPSFSTHLHSRFDLISTIEHLCSIPKDHLGPLSFKSEGTKTIRGERERKWFWKTLFPSLTLFPTTLLFQLHVRSIIVSNTITTLKI